LLCDDSPQDPAGPLTRQIPERLDPIAHHEVVVVEYGDVATAGFLDADIKWATAARAGDRDYTESPRDGGREGVG